MDLQYLWFLWNSQPCVTGASIATRMVKSLSSAQGSTTQRNSMTDGPSEMSHLESVDGSPQKPSSRRVLLELTHGFRSATPRPAERSRRLSKAELTETPPVSMQLRGDRYPRKAPRSLTVVMVHLPEGLLPIESISMVAPRSEHLMSQRHTRSSSDAPGPLLMAPERTTSLRACCGAPSQLFAALRLGHHW